MPNTTEVDAGTVQTPLAPLEETQIDRCIDLLREINRGMRKNTEEWRKLDLTMAQMKVMVRLHSGGEATLKQLAEELHVSAPSMSASVEKLVRSGQVIRIEHPEDRRFIIVKLTEDGQTMMDRLQQGRRVRMHSILEQLTPEQLDALESALTPLMEIIEHDPSR